LEANLDDDVESVRLYAGDSCGLVLEILPPARSFGELAAGACEVIAGRLAAKVR
jgi:hypothetical protein